MKYLKLFEEFSEELTTGIKIEMEHNDLYDEIRDYFEDKGEKCPWSSTYFYTKIAKAHLREIPDYYSRLKIMEKE